VELRSGERVRGGRAPGRHGVGAGTNRPEPWARAGHGAL